MKVFIDANILVSVLNKEYPSYSSTSRVLSFAGRKPFVLFTSTVCVAIAFYFAEKKHGSDSAKKRIALLMDHLRITSCGDREAKEAIQNQKAHDFEDALQYYSAVNAGCACIVTEDTADYYYAETEVMRAEEFLRKYLPKFS